jgi:hypothetical protein
MYLVQTYNAAGQFTGDLGRFGNVASARQAMLDHAGLVDLPADGPEYHVPARRIVEGWYINRTEYAIRQVAGR